MKQKNTIREVFREGSGFRYFLLCILITGLSYGLYKGMLDNYLAEVVKMGEMDKKELNLKLKKLDLSRFFRRNLFQVL